MFLYKNISIFSKTFLLLAGLVYFVDFILNGSLAGHFVLIPDLVISNFDVWRLVSYPFAGGSAESILLFSFTFYYISSKLEILVDKTRYPIWLFTLVFLQGLTMCLIFWQTKVVFAGMEGISFFILTLFALIQPKSKIEIYKFRPISVFLFTSILVSIWAIMKIYFFIYSGGSIPILPSITSALFGITVGLLIFLQVRLSKNIRRKKKQESINNVPAIQPEELSMAMQTASKFKKYYNSNKDEHYEDEMYFRMSSDAQINEEKLNYLLDKIFISGKDSLSTRELHFLEEYSKHL